MAMPAIEPASLAASGTLGPVAPQDRILQLDILRGWAVLGILAVNAMAFAWPFLVLTSGGDVFDHTGGDAWGALATEVFFHDKFRPLFTMLFGVSVFLVGGERDDPDRGRALRRRLLGLGAFGVIHGAAIWYGDILLLYAGCGLLMLLMRSWSARRLLWVGGGISLLWVVLGTLTPLAIGAMGPEFATQYAAYQPQVTMEQVQTAVAAYKTGGAAPWIENLKSWGVLAAASVFFIPVSLPLMMLGLGLFKTGFLTGRASVGLYLGVAVLGAAVLAIDGWASLPGQSAAAVPIVGLDDAGAGLAPLVTLGYVAMLILMTRFGLGIVTRRLAPVGRMAFTNYLAQSVIMASLFYLPWGPQWMGTMGPAALWPIVAGVWAAQLIWSPLWLSVFRMGPLEWLWRCLTYGRWVAFRN
ncbi:MAG: DUF418 domain-containing protein [Alphaproteobacteria bacterium]|nr:DUF418 domain-containing protein [Alphaproteobacteria bacterium]MBU2379180.1 DUF418 domain-containing protein [Alphaproteobacteria bacterium]